MASLRGISRYTKDYIMIKKGLDSPLYLIVFVSGRCNLYCRHCFWWDDKPHDEMTLAQYQIMSRTIKKPLNVLHLTGGEPMLRPDLNEICAAFAANNRPRSLTISSNCVFPDMVKKCKAILKACRDAGHEPEFAISTSLDGMEKLHDYLRGKKGAFKAVVKQVKLLKKAGIKVGVCATLSNENANEIAEVSKFARETLKVPFALDLVRGNPRVPEVRPPPFDPKYLDLETPFYKNAQKWHTKVKFDVLDGKKNKFKCLAGNLNGVVYSNGDVAICEIKKPFGNLKETGYDFGELWKRRDKPDGCQCTHGVNITSSMYYSLRTMKDVALRRWKSEKNPV